MELRESTQYPAQGTRDCHVGEFRQHVVPSPIGMFLHIAVQQCIYQYVLVCTGMNMLKLYFLCSMPTSRISKLWPTCPIIRTYSCASCDSMHVLATFSITRPCSRGVCVVDVYSSTYQYILVCTSMNFRLLNIAFFENRHHPSISLALELYAVPVYSQRAACMYEKPSCHVFCTQLYIPVRTGQEILYLHIPVHTGTYRYIPVHTILPDPVQVYRIPDDIAQGSRCRGAAAFTVTIIWNHYTSNIL